MALDIGQDFALDEAAHGVTGHFLLRAEKVVEVVEVEVGYKARHGTGLLRSI